MLFTIYGIYDPVTDELKYIGKTNMTIKKRLACHIGEAKSKNRTSNLYVWISEVLSNRQRPNIKSIECLDDAYQDWKEAEKKWIKYYRDSGIALLNTKNGGDGSHRLVPLDSEVLKLLGQITDQEIADLFGLSVSSIINHRLALGIAHAPPETYKYCRKGFVHPNKGKSRNATIYTKDILDKIGKMSDKEVAKLAGVGRKAIARFRKKHNIPKFITKGEKHHASILKQQDVEYIKNSHGQISARELSETFGVHIDTIYRIWQGQNWKA